jgi:hypothetical protein
MSTILSFIKFMLVKKRYGVLFVCLLMIFFALFVTLSESAAFAPFIYSFF